MPRQPRIDIPGLLQHVMVRGIERSEIFLDDHDRQRFVERFDRLLVKTGTDCYAWALLPNHAHLLLRCDRVELSRFMRSLLTGHAVYFNSRHNRSGHLFQNRYKSIVCEEDSYFQELVRYIHLNPLRAGLVSSFEELARYPWCGHSVMLGNQLMPGQAVDAVLTRFGTQKPRSQYRQFIADGIGMGEQPHRVEIIQKKVNNLYDFENDFKKDSVASDHRILGSSDFIQTLREQEGFKASRHYQKSLQGLQNDIEDFFGFEPRRLSLRGRQNNLSSARALFCFLAVVELRYSGVKAGEILGISGPSVSRAIRRGEQFFRSREDLQIWWESLMH